MDNEPKLFLTDEEVEQLTGWKRKKQQIEWLQRYGVRYYPNAAGEPVVVRSSVEGIKAASEPSKKWEPASAGL